MSQTVITTAFEQWKAAQAANGQAIVLDEFVFANVPNLDVNKPIDRAESVPPAAQIVYRQAVEKTGLVNQNAVVYSVTLGADVGDFSFNWIGLINKATGKLAMVVHAPLQSKVKNANGQQGNVLTRSFLMEYNGAETQTLISTPAETWQIDFTARLAGMDESLRLANLDIYGAGAFFDNGFLVSKTGTQFFVTAGVGYVGGLRASLAAKTNITVTTKPMKVWADVSYHGTLTSEYKTDIKFTLATTLKDYVQSGIAHYVFALASIDANGVVTDLRPKGSSLYLRRDKNLADIADPAAALNTLNGVPKTRTVNKKALTTDITLTPADVGAISNVMPNVDNATITKLYDPSIVGLSGGVTLAGYFDDHPLGATYQAADTLVSHRRWYNAGAALTQYLHCRTGTVYVRVGNVSTADVSGWAWVQTGATTLPFGWRKLFDSSSLELADLTRLGVARAGDNTDIVSMGKLTSIASSVKMAANLEVASSIQANYRMGILRANDYEAYMSFTSRVGTVSAANLPSALTSMGNMYFRVTNTLTDTDPHAGRALGGLSSAIYPAGEGVMRMDARDETGTIKARIVLDGQTDSVHVSNGVLRPEWGMTLTSTNANSVIRGRNDAVILRDHNNGNITLSASLKDVGTQIGGTLYIGYNRPEANIFTSAVSIDSPVTVNETMKVVKDATFASAMTVAGGLTLNTALPVSSGGTGAKTATDALKNLGGLPSNGTAVAATKLATARKIAGVAFDGTKDISLAAADVNAVPAAGGNVGYLNNATHYSIKPDVWEGVGGFANQYAQPDAPFIVPYGYKAPRDISSYAPIVKGVIQTTSYGYGTAVSLGALTSGGQKFASAVIHAIGDSGVSAAWVFDPMDGSFSCPGAVYGSVLRATNPPNPGSGQGTHIGWNESGSQGESVFINNKGGGSGGFAFRTVNVNNTQQTGYVRFSGVGDLNAQGNINTDTGGVFEKGQRVYSPNNRQPVNTNTANLGGGWWRCGDTGMIKQWGVVNKGSRGWSTVNFPIPFPNTCVNVQVTAINGGGGTFNDNFGTAQIINNIGFTCGQDSGGSYWEATGW